MRGAPCSPRRALAARPVGPDDSADAAPSVSALPSSVSDAPRVGRGVLRLPPIPAGFNSYDAGWVRFIYHPSSRERVQPLIAQAEAVRHDLTERLGFPVLSEVRVEIARTPGEMATFAPSGAPYPEYAAGVAYSELGLVLLSLTPIHAGRKSRIWVRCSGTSWPTWRCTMRSMAKRFRAGSTKASRCSPPVSRRSRA